MIRNKKFCTVALFAGMVLIGPNVTGAAASSDTYANYGRIGLGINSFSSNLDDDGYDAGANFSATYGRYLSQYLVVEGTLGYFHSDRDTTYGSTILAGAYNTEDSLDIGVVMGTVKVEVPLDRLALYTGVGVGGYSVTLESEIETALLGSFDTDDDDFVFGLHLVAGGNFDVTDRIFVGFEGMYRWTDDVDINNSVGTVPVLLTDNLNGFTFTATCGYRF